MDEKSDHSASISGRSSFSKSYHHPKLICEAKPAKIKVDPKTGVPQVSTRLNARNLKELDGDANVSAEDEFMTESVYSLSIRRKDETTQEKRARKAMVKEMRRERRIERKINQTAFKNEKIRQLKEASTARPGVKLA